MSPGQGVMLLAFCVYMLAGPVCTQILQASGHDVNSNDTTGSTCDKTCTGRCG